MRNTNKPGSVEARQLTAADIGAVAGGLNPQPLPPLERPMTFNVRTLNALRFTSVFIQ